MLDIAVCTDLTLLPMDINRLFTFPRNYHYAVKNPKTKMWLIFIVAFVVIALALFLAAGTVRYWQGWAYLGVCAVSGILLTLYTVKDPVLLEGRTKAGPVAEKRTAQKIILLCSAIPFVAMFILPPLDHRFGWSHVPVWFSVAGDLLILVSMWMVYRVFKENSFGSATVEVTSDQKVISTGPYAIGPPTRQTGFNALPGNGQISRRDGFPSNSHNGICRLLR